MKHLVHEPGLPDSAFVGFISDKTLSNAVSCMSVEQSTRLTKALLNELPQYDWVVFDCNISEQLIGHLAMECAMRNIRLVGAAASEKKAVRLLATNLYGTTALSMNMADAVALMRELAIRNGNLVDLKKALCTQTLMVTDGAKGWHLIQAHDELYKAPAVIKPVTTFGAGDAACAGLINALVQGLPIREEVTKSTLLPLCRPLPHLFRERTTPTALEQFRIRRQCQLVFWITAGTVAISAGTLVWLL